MSRNLQSFATVADRGPFTAGQLRWWIFNADENGLAALGAIVRIGRRIYIDADRFDDWIESQNQRSAVAA